MNGGISELIKHYHEDVFGRRNKLMNKCQHLQKIIDQYVEHTLLDPKIKNQYVTKEDYKEDNTSEHMLNNDDNMLLKEMESIAEEVNIEIQSTNEEVKIENQPITEEIVIDYTEIEQTEPVYIENTDIECRMDTDSDPRNIENIKSVEMDIGDRKINHLRTLETKKMDINLLKPITFEPTNTELESILRLSKNYVESQNRNLTNKRSPELFDRMKIPTRESPSSENFTDCKITRKLLNPCTVQNSRESLISHVEELEANVQNLQKVLNEFDEDFKHYEASQKINNISSKNTVSTQCNESSDNDNLIPTNDSEANSSNETNAVISIPVSNENDNCDSDIASYNENDAILMQYNSFIRDLLNLNNTLQIED